jgi:hypothetical protein
VKLRRRPKYEIPENWNEYKQQTYNFLYERHQKIRRPRKAEWVLQRIIWRRYALELIIKRLEWEKDEN